MMAVRLTASMPAAQAVFPTEDPDELYRRREELANARRAAALWEARTKVEFEAAWKLSRVCYWLGTHAPEAERRAALDGGVRAGETAVRIAAGNPEGHFWLAANMGALAESFGFMQGLKYRGRIKSELEQVIAIDPQWQEGSADVALGQWYLKVPRLLGGSRAKAEEHLRRALAYNADSRAALTFLAEVLVADGRRTEARALLQRVVDAPVDPDWIPEDNEYKSQAITRLQVLDRRR